MRDNLRLLLRSQSYMVHHGLLDEASFNGVERRIDCAAAQGTTKEPNSSLPMSQSHRILRDEQLDITAFESSGILSAASGEGDRWLARGRCPSADRAVGAIDEDGSSPHCDHPACRTSRDHCRYARSPGTIPDLHQMAAVCVLTRAL